MTSLDTSVAAAIRAEWVTAAKESDLGLWWLAQDVGEHLGDGSTDEAVLTWTLQLLAPLLQSREISAVTLRPDGGFARWDGDVERQRERIEAEWRGLGRQPDIGEIVWFIGPRMSSQMSPGSSRTR